MKQKKYKNGYYDYLTKFWVLLLVILLLTTFLSTACKDFLYKQHIRCQAALVCCVNGQDTRPLAQSRRKWWYNQYNWRVTVIALLPTPDPDISFKLQRCRRAARWQISPQSTLDCWGGRGLVKQCNLSLLLLIFCKSETNQNNGWNSFTKIA